MDEVCFESASALRDLIARRELSSVELTTAYLERIDRLDPLLRAFITVDHEDALAAARESDRVPSDRPLHGLPLALKDNIATRGLRTTAGSRVLADWVPEVDAPVVASLRGAGAVILGKTNLHEFAYGGTCTNEAFGAVRNPWRRDRVPGGSSGGSAVAVAAGLCAAALGTDTAGSVRLPASQCGLVGLKPTYGRSSIDQVIPLAWSLDHVGPLSRSVADAGLLFDVLAETQTNIDQPVAGLRLGIPRRYFYDWLQPDVQTAIEQAIEVFGELGAELVEVDWPSVQLSSSATWTIILAESSAFHRQWFRSRPTDYGQETRDNLDLAEHVSAADYVQAQRVRTVLQSEIDSVLASVDALLTPSLPITAPSIGQTSIELGGKTRQINSVFIRLTDPFNLTGQPALSVPCGFDSDGLPVGLQIAGRAFDERTVLRIGRAYEAATGWHSLRPSVSDTLVGSPSG